MRDQILLVVVAVIKLIIATFIVLVLAIVTTCSPLEESSSREILLAGGLNFCEEGGYSMAKTIAKGPTDTAFSGSTTLTVPIPGLNWTTDFRPLSKVPGEVVAVNVTCPVDQPETIRFSQRKIANVYNGINLDPAVHLPVKAGTATLIELRQLWVETDSVDTTYRKVIPVKVGITLTLPAYGNVTATMCLDTLKRAVAATF